MTVVQSDTLFFVSYAGDAIQVDHAVSLDLFLEDDFNLSSIPAVVQGRENRLLVVPDYWIGQTSLTLQSKKRSIVAPFVERKLASEHPELSDIGLFFDYAFSKEPSERGDIYAFFLQDPLSYQLYQKLAIFDMTPIDITIPAYVWGKKLEKLHPELADSGGGLIQKLSSASYLYFYHKGQFLFSRSIQFSDSAGGDTEALDALTYEINQSFYLFSQKEKAELEHIFIHSTRKEDAVELTESLGREVHSLDIGDRDDASSQARNEILGPCGAFAPNDLSPARKYPQLRKRTTPESGSGVRFSWQGLLWGSCFSCFLGGSIFFCSNGRNRPRAGKLRVLWQVSLPERSSSNTMRHSISFCRRRGDRLPGKRCWIWPVVYRKMSGSRI